MRGSSERLREKRASLIMHVVDTTMFFCQRGGGVKRYLLAKREWLRAMKPSVRHTLVVPQLLPDALGICSGGGFSIPLLDGYRFPLSLMEWKRSLLHLQPDLLEVGDPYVPAFAAREVAQTRGVPAIAFFHSDLPRMLEKRLGSWTAPMARAYLRNVYEGFDLVLAPSRSMMEKLDDFGVRNTRLQPLGVDPALFTPERADPNLRRSLELPADTRLLVYAGRFAREKNLGIMMRAVERLGAPYHLLLVGADEQRRVSPLVTYLPYEKEPARLARVLASCDALVHAGDQETFGLIAIEAMACGLPVVAVAAGGMKELVDETVGMTIPHPAAGLMAEAIDALFTKDRFELGSEARARVLRSYSWAAALHGLGQLYDTLHGSNVRSPRTGPLQYETTLRRDRTSRCRTDDLAVLPAAARAHRELRSSDTHYAARRTGDAPPGIDR